MKKTIDHIRNKRNILHIFFLLSILIIAFLLRSKLYLQGDFNYNLDQSRDLLLVKDIVEKNKLTLIGGRSGFGGIFHGPLWLYIILPFFILTKGNPFLTLVPLYVIFDIGLIILGYYFIKKLYSKTAGLIFSLLLAISGPFISFSSNFSNSNIMPLIFLIYLFLGINFLRSKENCLIYLLFILGIGFQFQSAFAIFLLPILITIIFIKKKLPNIKFLFIGLISLIISLSTFILFDIRHNFLMSRSALKILSMNTPPMHAYEKYADIGYRIFDRLYGFADYFFRPLYHQNLLVKILTVIILIGFLEIVYKNKNKQNTQFRKEILFLFLIPVLYFSIYILYPYPLWSHYTSALTVSSCLLLSLAISKLIGLKIKYVALGLILFLIMILAPVFARLIQDYTQQNTEQGGYKKQLSVADYIFKDAKNNSFGYLVYDHGQLTYNMDYLMWWRANKIYHVPLINNKQSLTYLIIYTPPVFAKNGPEYWKKNVIKSGGTIIDRKSFTKDITLEKLKIDNVEKEEPIDPNYFQNLIFR
ncbi:MAG: glycosyltransferase family 39 protein [Candidatus Roizmanbacteria bacterium]